MKSLRHAWLPVLLLGFGTAGLMRDSDPVFSRNSRRPRAEAAPEIAPDSIHRAPKIETIRAIQESRPDAPPADPHATLNEIMGQTIPRHTFEYMNRVALGEFEPDADGRIPLP